MAISVGEVEATIRLRDELTAQMSSITEGFKSQMEGLKARVGTLSEHYQSVANAQVGFGDKMAAAGAKAEGAIEGLLSKQINLVGMLSTYLAPAAIGAAVLKTADWADSISEMSIATGIGTEKL